jgi:hypothetical protein
MYTAGITTRAANADAARALIDLLTGNEQHQLRVDAGFPSNSK